MKKRLGGVAIAVAAVIGFASAAAAGTPPGIVITPGYLNVITTQEATTFSFTGCEGTVDFVLDFIVDGVEQTVFLDSVPGSTGSFTFTWPTPGTFKIIVNCFPDEGPPSTDFVFVEVIPPPVATTAPTTAPPVPTTAAPVPGPAPTTAAPPVPTTTPALPGATTTSVVGALAPATTRGASASGAGALPATGQGGNAGLLAAAGALLVIGTTLVLVRRRPA